MYRCKVLSVHTCFLVFTLWSYFVISLFVLGNMSAYSSAIKPIIDSWILAANIRKYKLYVFILPSLRPSFLPSLFHSFFTFFRILFYSVPPSLIPPKATACSFFILFFLLPCKKKTFFGSFCNFYEHQRKRRILVSGLFTAL